MAAGKQHGNNTDNRELGNPVAAEKPLLLVVDLDTDGVGIDDVPFEVPAVLDIDGKVIHGPACFNLTQIQKNDW